MATMSKRPRRAKSNPLLSVYTAPLPGVMRSASELHKRLNGERVDWLRIQPTDEDKAEMQRLLKHLVAKVAK